MWSRPFLRRVNAAAREVLAACPPAIVSPAGGRTVPVGIRRILLVKLVGMGDAVLVRSLAEHLRRARPGISIGVLTGPATRDVLASNSSFRVHVYDPAGADRGILSALSKIREIRSASYDVAVDFEQHIVLVALFLSLARIPGRVGLAAQGNPRSRFQTHTVLLSGATQMWGAYRALLEVVEPSISECSTLPLPRSMSARAAVDEWWRRNGLDRAAAVVALHLGCGSRAVSRRWPVERFVQLARRLFEMGHGDVFLLTGTVVERPLIREFQAVLGGCALDASGLGSVDRVAELLHRCHLAVSNDTGIMHLAAAMGTPTVGLFGPNSPQRYAPVGARTAWVYAGKVPCSPCIHVHDGVVPECTHPEPGRCLLDIDVGSVYETAVQLLSRCAKSCTRSGRRLAQMMRA